MRALKLLLFLIFILIPLTGCGNVLYVSRLGWHQGAITFHSVPIQEVLEDEGVNPEMKEKIRLIQEVKRFGEERLGLEGRKSYSKFFEVKGPVLYVITASERDRLQLHSWNFPIVGRVTYKSFFTREEALKEERFLKGRSFDTFVQRVGAYSTLGWLKDPIFPSMLEWEDSVLANLVLHEMTHATVYFKGQTDFNEQVATFVGNRGAIDFMTEKYGPRSKEAVRAIDLQKDDILFARFINQACQQLSNFYAKEGSKDEKLRGRKEIFQSIKEEFHEIKAQFNTDDCLDFDKIDLNNAVLLAYRRYIRNLEKHEILYEYLGRDLEKVVEFFKKIRASGEDPSSFTFPSFLR
jgi:predicted aminopeptidase